jgi:hypothetical protein
VQSFFQRCRRLVQINHVHPRPLPAHGTRD